MMYRIFWKFSEQSAPHENGLATPFGVATAGLKPLIYLCRLLPFVIFPTVSSLKPKAESETMLHETYGLRGVIVIMDFPAGARMSIITIRDCITNYLTQPTRITNISYPGPLSTNIISDHLLNPHHFSMNS